MKNSEKFLKNLFKAGDATFEEIQKFMIEEYFLQDKTFSDFENDLEQIYNCSDNYAVALTNDFKSDFKKYAKELKYTSPELSKNSNRHDKISLNDVKEKIKTYNKNKNSFSENKKENIER